MLMLKLKEISPCFIWALLCCSTRLNLSHWSPELYFPPIFQDSELLDKRRQCFSVQMDTGEDVVFSVELESDLVLWEKAFQMATFLEVERIQVSTFHLQYTKSRLTQLIYKGEYKQVRNPNSFFPSNECVVFQSKTYACITESHLMGLTIDFSTGFICFDAASKVR